MNPFFRFPVLAPASRTIPARSKASARVQVVDVRSFLPCPVISRLESGLEAHCWDQLIANPEFREVQAQPPVIRYRDARGRPAVHHFDFRALLTDGNAIAVAVRPLARVRKYRFEDTLRLIASQLPRSFATRVLLFTDADIPQPEVVPHAPTTRLIERARELGAPMIPAFTHMILA
ncbi:hypothetical protein SAMN05444389_101564 [Paracoccus solventivorans]|uniref:TnsA endonuclease N terminal n=1 Tax=Paracoccus solventivorans TaxID=53463 RepID=A0A1M7DU55_9RHOB|nr:hypothetical protein [Paracoccus solventivorans]SHL82913.1 hypothetical protein SAMN05444389_101564 [Paracoccus solventivorans]